MLEIIVNFSKEIIGTSGIIAQVLATFYIGIAIFVAEGTRDISHRLNLKLDGSFFAKLLNFWKATIAVTIVAVLPSVVNTDLSTTDFKGIKYILAAMVTVLLIVHIIRLMRTTLDHASADKIRKLYLDNADNTKRAKYSIAGWSNESKSPENIVENEAQQELEDELLIQLKKLLKEGIEKQKDADILARTLSEFIRNFDKRPLDNWHYYGRIFDITTRAWKNLEENYHEATKSNFYGIQRALVRIIEKLVIYGIENQSYTDLPFEKLSKLIFSLNEESQVKFFRQFDIETVFFNKIPEQDYANEIWEDYFPEEWKSTYNNLVEKPNPVSIHIYNSFMRWAQGRFFKDKPYDKNLDDVAVNLFPGLDPIMWARLIEYRYAAWVDDKHLGYIIKQMSNFGIVKNYPSHDYIDEKTMLENIKNADEKMIASTSKLTLSLGLYNKEYIDDALAQAAELKKDKALDDRERRKLDQYINFFKRLKKDLKNTKNK